MLDQSTLDKLASVDSSTIANLIELFDVQPRVAGFANETIKALYPDLPPVVGYDVMIGGLAVAQGDLVHADANGVVRIPDELAPHVAYLIDPFMDTEQRVMDTARAPGATADGITEEITAHYGRLDKLREEAKRRIG